MCHTAIFYPAPDIVQQVLRRANAGVGQQQGGFQVFIKLLVNLAASEHCRNA